MLSLSGQLKLRLLLIFSSNPVAARAQRSILQYPTTKDQQRSLSREEQEDFTRSALSLFPGPFYERSESQLEEIAQRQYHEG